MNNKNNKKEDLITQEEITFFFNSIDAIFIKLNKNILEVIYIWNQVENILGYEEEEIIKDKNWFIKNIHTDDRNKVIEELRILTIFNITNTIFFRFRNKNGKYLILKIYLIAYKDYIFSLLFDMTFEKAKNKEFVNYYQPIIDISKINLDEIDFNKDIVNIPLNSVNRFWIFN
jgi:PAS domain-containing protein